MSGQSDLTHTEVARILKLVNELDNIDLQIEYEGMKLHVIKGDSSARVTRTASDHESVDSSQQSRPPVLTQVNKLAPADKPPAEPATVTVQHPKQASTVNQVTIPAPLMGTFYRSASPSEPPYVEIGSRVSPDDTVGIIEVMKLFNEVKSCVSGTIVEVVVANEEQVAEGAILFVVDPD